MKRTIIDMYVTLQDMSHRHGCLVVAQSVASRDFTGDGHVIEMRYRRREQDEVSYISIMKQLR
jgi:hypothetical protein